MSSAPEVKYARSGGAQIAYQVLGDGAHDLIFVTNWATNTEAMWDHPAISSSWKRVSRWARVIIFDQRGSGLSDRSIQETNTIEGWADDITAVLDAVGSEQATLTATNLSGPIALAYAAMRPDRVASLVLYDATARMLDAPGYDVGLPASMREQVIDFLVAGWGDPESDFHRLANPGEDRDSERRALARLQRLSLSPDAVRKIFEMTFDLDVRHLLPSIQAPTLIAHRTGTDLMSAEHSRYLAEHIPNSTYIELPGHEIEDPERWEAEMQSFVTGARVDVATDRVLLTLMFTDIVDSTPQLARAGDRRWKATIDQHDAIVRDELARFGGREVSTAGDSFFAVFDGPARAIRWGAEVRDRLRREGIDIRAGGHCGEVLLRGDDVAGIAVVIAARVVALADAGEIVVTTTVKDLVAGSGIAFVDRGRHGLKGVPDQWHLFAVDAV